MHLDQILWMKGNGLEIRFFQKFRVPFENVVSVHWKTVK